MPERTPSAPTAARSRATDQEIGRCVCACPREQHDHYRRGADCGHCGKVTCPRFIPLSARDTAFLSIGQRLALAESDARFYYNLWHLSEFTPRPVPPMPRRRQVTSQHFIAVPAQRGPSEPRTGGAVVSDALRAQVARSEAMGKYRKYRRP